jgi:multiple sugar transport system permease protein
LSKALDKFYPYLYFFPILFFFSFVLIYPWALSFYYSFFQYKPTLTPEVKFIGLGNYIKIVSDPSFYNSLFVTFYFIAGAVTLEFFLGIGIALLLDREFKMKRVITTLILVPMVVSPAFAALSFRQFIHPLLGLFNFSLTSLGLPPQDWMGNPSLSIPVAIMIDVWQNTSFVTLIILAGLQALPVEQVEAALVDGASSWQIFKNIKIPFLKPLMLLALMFRIMFALRVFETVMLTFSETGGPANAAQVLGVYLYWIAFRGWDLGMASALSWLMLFLTIGLTLALVIFLYKEIEL